MLRGHRRGEKEVLVLNALYVSLAAVGGLLLLLGMLGGLLKERTPLSEPLIALLAGVLIGPAAFGLLDLAELGNETLILEEAALVTLGVALVGVALRLPVGSRRVFSHRPMLAYSQPTSEFAHERIFARSPVVVACQSVDEPRILVADSFLSETFPSEIRIMRFSY